jgi:hypothetical protein
MNKCKKEVVECPPNCEDCLTSNDCSKCATGYNLVDNNCIKVKEEVTCFANCVECTTATDCQKCKTGYLLNDNKCLVECFANCLSCKTSNSCETCADGYYLSEDKCIKHSEPENTTDKSEPVKEDPIKCPKNCKMCKKDSATCTECITGYELDWNDNVKGCKKKGTEEPP